MRLYHIDRSMSLKENQIINTNELHSYVLRNKENLLINKISCELSPYGEFVFGNQASESQTSQVVNELIFEYERKLNFPNLPSRLQSFFAVRSIEDAKLWLELFGEAKIWEIDTLDSKFVELDSKYLIGGDISAMSTFKPALSVNHARMYWSGRESENPRNEVLISPRVQIIKEFTNY